ncbi:hypothetical protein J4E00_05830 [Siccationidurans soli]|uniref:SWIM-type domain-containing protein n=1 Tax=Hymenobacter negativus TaxID=2795026 RepID=A0ABS3QBE1_9BACT|nr:hypothetical protein [Hymenobacter negativus]
MAALISAACTCPNKLPCQHNKVTSLTELPYYAGKVFRKG